MNRAERPEDLDTALEDAALKLQEAVLAMGPLATLTGVSMWQWGEVQAAHEALTQVMERVEWYLRGRCKNE